MQTQQFYLLILFLYCLLDLLNSTGLRCTQVLNNDAFFSLEDLTSTNDYIYQYTTNGITYNLYYNFCRLTSRTCHSENSYAMLFPLDASQQELNNSCIRLTSDNALSNFTYSLNNPDDPSTGIQLTLTGGDNFNQSLLYQFTFQILCDKDDLGSKFIIDNFTQDENAYLAIGRSNDGCPLVQISEVYGFIVNYKYIFGILSIFLGIIECFFGLRILKPSLFIVGYFSGFGFLILIFGEFVMTPNTSVLLIWMLLLIAVFFGAITGHLATTLPRIGFMGLGVWLGFVLAFVINNLFLYKIEVNPPGLLLYILMGILGIIFAILSMYFWRQICILATSFLGSYLVIRSLSLYIGHYPDELTLSKQIQYKELANVGWEFYVYFIFIMLLTAVGAIVQFRNKMKIGGKFAGEFDNLDPEAIGDTYVEMNALEEAQNQKNLGSVIREENEDLEDMISKKTHKENEDSQLNSRDEAHNFKENHKSKSFKIPNVQEMEEVPKKKSFQGEIRKKHGEVTPPKKSLHEEKKKNSFIELQEQNKEKNIMIELKEKKIKQEEDKSDSGSPEENESQSEDDKKKADKDKKNLL